MSNCVAPLLVTLPIELAYRILDHLSPLHILVSVRDVCTRLDLITDTYYRYQHPLQTLTTLDLSHNQIGLTGLQHLANALEKNTTLTTLDLSSNQICDQGAQYLINALEKNTTLIALDLTYNQIDDERAQYLANALEKNRTLAVRNIQYSEISAKVRRYGEERRSHIRGRMWF